MFTVTLEDITERINAAFGCGFKVNEIANALNFLHMITDKAPCFKTINEDTVTAIVEIEKRRPGTLCHGSKFVC